MSIEKELTDHMLSFMSDNKNELFLEKIEDRTKHITVVIEDIFQSQNASAVLRSCDCFGIQDIHVIENRNEYDVNPDVALGSSKWLNLHKYSEKENNTLDCLNDLKSKGYRIVATTPHEKDSTISQLDISQKTALVFGTELLGISDIVRENADDFVKIPMYGFTESFNISVSAALCLYELTKRIRQENIDWKLSENDKTAILLSWAKNVVKSGAQIEKRFLQENK